MGRLISPHFTDHNPLAVDEFAGDTPLVKVFRGLYVNSVHRGVLTVTDPGGQDVLSLGDHAQPVFLRSAAKPFQVMPALLSEGIDRFGITERELAVLCASHQAEPRHIEAVLSVLGKLGLDESALHCGVHPPSDEETARSRLREGIEPTPVCNNCSGAHSGMLVACLAEGWPVDTYDRPDHPLQVRTREILAAFAGMPAGQVTLATDNCAVPTFRVPLARAAQAFARLATGEGVDADLREAARRVVAAMTGYPEMVGGKGNWDTALMRAGAGSIASKGGADGFQGIGSLKRGLGLAIRISDGNSRIIPPAVIPVLESAEMLGPEELGELDAFRMIEIRSHQGELVGRVESALNIESEG